MRRLVRAALAGATATTLLVCGCASPERTRETRAAVERAPHLRSERRLAADEASPVQGADDVLFAFRGPEFFAAWMHDDVAKYGLWVTSFDAAGVPNDPIGTEPIALADGATIKLVALTCAPSGPCLVVNYQFSGDGIDAWQLRLTLVRTDGTSATARIVTNADTAAAAFDGHDFLVAWADGDLYAQHVTADGALVEPAPVALGGAVESVGGAACSPDNGCIVTYEGSNLSPYSVQVPPGSLIFAPPVFLGAGAVGQVAYGGGVYDTAWCSSDGVCAQLRLGLDGGPMYPAATILNAQQDPTLVGLGYDGATFTAVADGHRIGGGREIVAARVNPDGTSPTPQVVDLSPFKVGATIACGDGACACALRRDPAGLSALSTVTIADGVATTSTSDLTYEQTDQSLAAVLPLGGAAVAVWNEGVHARLRRFDPRGAPLGDVEDLSPVALPIAHATADGDLGLLWLRKDDHAAGVTRIVAADGTVADAVSAHPPSTSSHAHARFVAVDSNGPIPSDKARTVAFRFDAAGHPLDPKGIDLVPPDTAGTTDTFVARAGDTFLIAFDAQVGGTWRPFVARLRDDGELLGVAELPHGPGTPYVVGLACSSDQCAVLWSVFDHADKPLGLHGARFDPDRLATSTTAFSVSLDATDASLVWDGRAFVAAYLAPSADELLVLRLDAGGPVTAHAALPSPSAHPKLVSPAVGASVVFYDRASEISAPLWWVNRVFLLAADDGRPAEPSAGAGGGGAGGGSTSAQPDAAGGCGCGTSSDERGAGVLPVALVALCFRARRNRRRRRGGLHG